MEDHAEVGLFCAFAFSIVAVFAGCHSPNWQIKQPAHHELRVLDRIAAIQAGHQREIMSIPGVVGIGIGCHPDSPCIEVLLERYDIATEAMIPKELEGIPIKLTVTGRIEALTQSTDD